VSGGTEGNARRSGAIAAADSPSHGRTRAPSDRRTLALALCALLLAALFIAVPAWQLIVPGPFDWHIAQPAFVQGGAEALLLIALVAGTFALAPARMALPIAALPLAFYLRRHAVDVPLLIDVLYLEIVVGLGALVRRSARLSPPRDAAGYLQAFLAGFVAWELLAWSLSALDIGSIRTLRALILLLAIPAACGGHVPLLLHLWRRCGMQVRADRFWCGALTAWVAVLYAHSKVAIGYDSLWYGLRPEYVLDPGNSVYEPLGLVSVVHYYPKLYEVFLLPVSALGDNSVMAGMTILMLVLILLACQTVALRIGLPDRARLPVLALVATLPALANSALGPKPDVISVLFVLLAADAALRWSRSRAHAHGAWMLGAGLLACLAKLTAIPFVGMLVLASAISAWCNRADAPLLQHERGATRLALAWLAGTLVLAAFVTARTLVLAGVPTILQVDVWQRLGLTLSAPAATLHWARPADWTGVPSLAFDWLFRPQRLEHIVISWGGNVWAWCALLALVSVPFARLTASHHGYSRVPLFALIGTGTVLAIGVRYLVRGGDGNYFLPALLPAILVSAGAAFTRLVPARRAFAAALACLPAFVVFQSAYAFASAAWHPGTRAFDLDLARTWHTMRRQRRAVLDAAGLARIGDYLRNAPGQPRAVGYAQEPASFWLPARFEYLLSIGYGRDEYVDDPQRFLCFLRDQRIDYLVLPKPTAPRELALVTDAVKSASATLEADPAVRRVDDRNYVLLDLAERHASAGNPDRVNCPYRGGEE